RRRIEDDSIECDLHGALGEAYSAGDGEARAGQGVDNIFDRGHHAYSLGSRVRSNEGVWAFTRAIVAPRVERYRSDGDRASARPYQHGLLPPRRPGQH